ncbi:uncharacterized protein LY79DRAFT_591707 [Colletotrichum navitas]|uniref:Uncharacterized protein n=1 Tax=Colletotrichum navitas TaxID=681940 RepID=A0AAD8V1D2_9PEZI|nr:uncharacterized protein LY79DRAFT_591707 [Colletotrichum navitas]KAK1585186.1 hypothetical protein LY79DRAFT_591707 [Colletotrichum navitas]
MGVPACYSTRRPGSHHATAAAILLFIIRAFWIRAENLDPSLQVQVTLWVPNSRGDDYFDHPPLDSSEVRSVCNGQKWDSNTNTEVVFTCDNSVGEIVDTRNSILNCVRYAIPAGGSLVMPRIIVRKGSGKGKHVGYTFDADHFIKSLRLSCPLLRLYDDVEEKIPSTGIQHPNRWRGQLYDWLGQVQTDVSPTGRPNYGGHILKFRPDARELATKALLQMAKISGSKLTQPEGDAAPSKPGTYAGTIPENAYLGIYLQEGKDSEETRTLFAETKQTADYLEQAVDAGLSLVYIANGDATQVKSLKSEAKAKSITVVTKQDFLGNKNGLENLQRDQQALVDFLVLLSASHFSGAACSSFSWNVALKRHLLVQSPRRKHWDGPQTFKNRPNHLHGEPESCPEFFACLWP